MKLQAVFTRDELVSFASQWLPLKVLLGDPSNEDRYLLLSEPKAIELVPGAGLRLSCRAQIRWPVLGMSVPITARHMSVLVRPLIETLEGRLALVFRVRLEQADLSAVPARLDATIRDAINRALTERIKPAWKFGSMLSRSIPMPVVITTTDTIELGVDQARADVTEDGFVFELHIQAGTTRRRLTMTDPR